MIIRIAFVLAEAHGPYDRHQHQISMPSPLHYINARPFQNRENDFNFLLLPYDCDPTTVHGVFIPYAPYTDNHGSEICQPDLVTVIVFDIIPRAKCQL